MIPLHRLWVNSNNRKHGQFEYDVNLFIYLFIFDFVHSHARCRCCFIVCLRFQVMQIKLVNCKMSTKKTFLRKHFVIFLDKCINKNVKPRKSSEASAHIEEFV